MPVGPTSDQAVKITVTDAPVRVSLSGEQPVITAPVEQVRIIKAGTLIQPVYQGSGGAAMVQFVADEWVLEGGQYYLDLLHNLESANAVIIRVSVAGADDLVIAFSKVENYTTNKIRVWIPAEPDGRFSGTATILGVTV